MAEPPQTMDPRRRRTHAALLSAFLLLALEQRYHQIRIDDILRVSGVGRSTFYEHFAGKDALLAASMHDALSLLARMPAGGSSAQQVAALLAHFWDNRALARSLLHGTALRVVRNALVGLVEGELKPCGRTLQLPPRLAAHALADGMLSPVIAWLDGQGARDSAALANALRLSSSAMLASMLGR